MRYVRQAGRDKQEIHVTTLFAFDPEEVGMFTIIAIGNPRTYSFDEMTTTPRGYYCEAEEDVTGIGQDIMIYSFRTIDGELENKNILPDHKWALPYAIHTTANFDMEKLPYTDPGAMASLYRTIGEGKLKTIVIDVTMAASGIRRSALQCLDVEVRCYLNDKRIAEIAASKDITHTQVGIRLAVKEHSDALFVFGNAPTALMEPYDLVRRERTYPPGIVAAPVDFAHMQESKYMTKPFIHIPKLTVEGRKGGSNLVAALVNAILCYPDAEQLGPGRDV